ncbi:hypothetical protein HK405_006680 [Cladochytrium tenue]|nr:hypothetical protein HK405_006680 [Cladochytrium tenue]
MIPATQRARNGLVIGAMAGATLAILYSVGRPALAPSADEIAARRANDAILRRRARDALAAQQHQQQQEQAQKQQAQETTTARGSSLVCHKQAATWGAQAEGGPEV